MDHSRKKLELTGQRYGKFTVLGPADNIGSHTAWRCRCDCGGERVVETKYLRNGHVTSCGCVPHGLDTLTYVDGTCVEMLASETIRKNNTSGVTGVDWVSSKGLWRAMICFKGKRYYLGSYARFEDAVEVRKQAEASLHDKLVSDSVAEALSALPGN